MKTKGGREMNPTDAYRKQARKREIKRNRAERHYIREAFNKKTQAQSLKEELEQLIAVEQNGGELNKLQKLRKKVVMEAYEAAIRRQKEDELRKRQAEEEGTQLHAGLSSVPLPKPPPLPAGPKPGLPPPPAAPPLPAGPAPGAAGGVLPPPPGPPPGAAPAPAANGSSAPILPPPPGPPPSSAAAALLPPPPGPPPAAAFGVLPPPTGPPPGAWLPPPAMPPPAAAAAGGILPPPAMPPPAAPAASILPPPSMPPPGQPSSSILPPPPSNTVSAAAAVTKQATGLKAGGTTITGASTVAKRPLAHKDKALTSMVPASVLVRREAAAAAAAAADGKTRKVDLSAEVQVGPGFGLAPVQKSAVGGRAGASKLSQQLQQPQEQGKWSSVVQTFVAPAVQAKAAAGGGNRPAVNVDQKLADFMDSLKDLGAFE